MEMIIRRAEGWGELQYNLEQHRFLRLEKRTGCLPATPYVKEPMTLNVDLTFDCNMQCVHCVAKDFGSAPDLSVSPSLMKYLNESPFMEIVITGGEPLLHEHAGKLCTILGGVRNKGLIVDTNGTTEPGSKTLEAIRRSGALIRVSWDSVRPQDEIHYRRGPKEASRENAAIHVEYYWKKVRMIRHLVEKRMHVAVQTVIHPGNLHASEHRGTLMGGVLKMPDLLQSIGVKKWYVQRFIPSYRVAEESNIEPGVYERVLATLKKRCVALGIDFVGKKDKRHNCVFLLIGEGLLYTQGEVPRQKIYIGSINDEVINYFDYVSSPDHSDRYYGR